MNESEKQAIFCLQCARNAKEKATKNGDGFGPADNPVGLAVTWEVALTEQGFPLGPYPVCIEHLTIVSSKLARG
jgi:hypothetical protein